MGTSEAKNSVISRIVEPRQISFGGFGVRRSMPAKDLYSVGPWLFFDHFGPVTFDKNQGIDITPHPHINLSTVTYLFDGEIVHRDTIESVQTIRPGAINLMYAGRGIAHSERTGERLRSKRHSLHGLQLWTGLPENYEEMAPAFFHYPSEDIPMKSVDDVRIRVMMGNAFGLSSPVKTLSPTLYAEAEIPQGREIEMKCEVEELAIYTVSGSVRAGDTTVPEHRMALLKRDRPATIAADVGSRIVIIGGKPLGRRYMWWNFVSSRRDRIEEAKDNWNNGRFGRIPGERDYQKLPDKDSFFD